MFYVFVAIVIIYILFSVFSTATFEITENKCDEQIESSDYEDGYKEDKCYRHMNR